MIGLGRRVYRTNVALRLEAITGLPFGSGRTVYDECHAERVDPERIVVLAALGRFGRKMYS